VKWLPGYYTLRDRAPFFLSCVYLLYLRKLESKEGYAYKIDYQIITQCLIKLTWAITAISVVLYITDTNLSLLFGIKWSYPAPIEWGSYILIGYKILKDKGLPIFEAYYLAFITAFAGGWLYEIPRWIYVGTPFAILKINYVKVFFIEFQLLCIPIAYWVITNRTTYRPPTHINLALFLYLIFSVLNVPISYHIPIAAICKMWRWIIRVPTQLILLYILTGIKGGLT